VKAKSSDSISTQDLEDAVNDLSMMPYFPTESRAAVMSFLLRICPHRTALQWLVSEAVNRVPKWPGPAELRGLLCTRYDAADGVDGYCSLPGYSAAEMEAKAIERHEQLKAGGWEAERLAQLAAGKEPLRIGSGKRGAA
jgi:hypothetical protein